MEEMHQSQEVDTKQLIISTSWNDKNKRYETTVARIQSTGYGQTPEESASRALMAIFHIEVLKNPQNYQKA